MYRNVFNYLVILILSNFSIALSHSMQCYSGHDTSSNVTCNSDKNSSAIHCITTENTTSHDWTYSCDDQQLCAGKFFSNYFHMCNKGVLTHFSCCSENLCNDGHPTLETFDSNFTCPLNVSESSCTSNYCTNTTIITSNGTLLIKSVDCYYNYKPNICDKIALSQTQTELPDGNIKKVLVTQCLESCSPFSTPSNPLISSPGTPKGGDSNNSFSTGVVMGAIFVLVSGVVLIGVGIKKCYERHLNKRLEYSYAQLTIDMLDDDDDHLILP